ncbi:MAG: hypothetical protein ACUVX9_08625 [Anaerolineae bacterium]
MIALGIVVILLLTMAYVLSPLLKMPAPATAPVPPPLPSSCIVDGVYYGTHVEWAIERALGRAGEGEPDPEAARQRAALSTELEQRVQQVRRQYRSARVQKGRVLCVGCGKPYAASDRYCSRCGEPHPRVCRRCGERHRPGDCYCTACGLPLPAGGRP